MSSFKSLRILFKYPTRGRVEKFFSTLNSYYELMVGSENFNFLISVDEDDLSMNNQATLSKIAEFKNANVVVGKSSGKIGAVNRDMEEVSGTYDIIVLVSDDMIPIIKGYDMTIRRDMYMNYPDMDGVLWYNDGHQGDRLNTLCILGSKYYDRFGYIYHPSYKSLFCDNEFMEVSKMLDKVKYFDRVIIEHQHWAWGYGDMDELYKLNEGPIHEDRVNFETRRKSRFSL